MGTSSSSSTSVADAGHARFFFETPALPEETLQVASFVVEASLSQPFRVDVDLVSEDPAVDFDAVVNQPAALTILHEGEPRAFHGVVTHFEQGHRSAAWHTYRAVLVPRFWLTSLTFQSRVFLGKTVEEIVSEVLEGNGLSSSDFRFELSESYAPMEYCVQHQETDLAFVQRRLEHEGIAYFFEHADDHDVLVMTDDRSVFPRVLGTDAVPFNAGDGLEATEAIEAVREVTCRQEVVTGRVVLKDYNPATPFDDLRCESQINGEMPGMRYEYGPHVPDTSVGDRIARVRNEEIECQRRVLTMQSDCAGFRAGHVFTLEEHYRPDVNDDYLVTRITHRGSQGGGIEHTGGTPSYQNTFTAIPASVPYRPPRRTPVPDVPGLVVARTETAGGDYAYLDEEGRYHARMNFDLGDTGAGSASAPIRMNQSYSGPGYGIHFPNHAETELLVAHVNGDVDRPLALGTVPNPTQQSPATSGNKAQNVIRTWGQNELTFDDSQGSENIYLHGTKDWTIDVTNDKIQTVGHDETTDVGNNQTLTVGTNRDKTVGANQTETIGGNKTIAVTGTHTETITGTMSQTVQSSKSETIAVAKALSIGGAYQVSVGGAENHTVGGLLAQEVGAAKTVAVAAMSSEDVGASKSVSAGSNVSFDAGKGFSAQAGDDVVIQAGKSMSVSAGDDFGVTGGKKGVITIEDELTIKVGKASITMKKNGDIQIKGKNVDLKGSGKINVKASSDVKIKGSKTGIN